MIRPRAHGPLRRRAATAGFTLLEVVLAMFLLLLGATAILGMLSFGASTARSAGLRSEASDAVPAIVADLEESLFPLVVEDGVDVAGDPPAQRSGLPVPGYPALTYAYRTTPDPDRLDAAGRSLEYRVDVAISWREGGEARTVTFTTLLPREVPFGERLRRRFVEGIEPQPADASAPDASAPGAPRDGTGSPR